MAIWAVGDIQGCRPELERLLERIGFDPAGDRLWLCGDLVNRGGESLAVLRLLYSLRASVTLTLGNHDLSLLAIAERSEEAQAKVNPDLREVLFAEDRGNLLDWLAHGQLLHHEPEINWCMVHACIAPYWSVGQARREAQAVEETLQGPGRRALLAQLFGDKPARWSQDLRGHERLRATINVLTRMRYCDVHGRIQFHAKGIPGSQRPGQYPWFAVPGMKRRKQRIVFGHWSALDRFSGLGVYALDTGCVWGGQLTALRLDSEEPQHLSVPAGPDRKPRPDNAPPRKPAHRRRRKRSGGRSGARDPAVGETR